MNQPVRLILEIPKDAKPRTNIDLRALCAPPGSKAPAHLRMRFAKAARKPAPAVQAPILPPPAPVEVQAVQPQAVETISAAASAPVIAAPSSSDELVIQDIIAEEPVQVLPVNTQVPVVEEAASEAVTETEESVAEIMTPEAAVDLDGSGIESEDEELEASPVAEVLPAQTLELLEDPEDASGSVVAGAVDPNYQPQPTTEALARDIDQFVDEQETADAAVPYPVDDEEYVSSLSGGPLAGFGTLIMAVLTLAILTTAGFFLWSEYSKRQKENPKVANKGWFPVKTTNTPATDKTAKDNPAKNGGQVNKGNPDSEKTLEPKKEPVPEPEAEPKPEPKKPATDEPKGGQDVYPELGLGGQVEMQEDPDEESYAFGFGADVGLEEETPGLIDRIEALRAKAIQLENSEKYQNAIEVYAEILALAPADMNAQFRTGTLHYKLGHYDQAEASYRRCLETDPKSSRTQNNVGLVLLAKGKRQEAKDYFEKSAAQRNPDALTNLANEYVRDGQESTAAGYYRQALEITPNHSQAKYGLGLVLRAEDEEEARALFESLAEDEHVGAKAQLILGQLDMANGKVEQALQSFRKALKRNPRLFEARNNLALALMKTGQDTKAFEQLQQALRDKPKDPVLWMNLGITAMKRGQTKYAKKCYEYSLRLDSSNPKTHFNYALCAQHFRNNLIAISEYKQVLKLDPYNWQAAYNIGLIYLRGQKYEDALSYLDQSISIQGRNPDVHLSRAKALLALNRVPETKKALQSFLLVAKKSHPHWAEVKGNLDKLEALQENNQAARKEY